MKKRIEYYKLFNYPYSILLTASKSILGSRNVHSSLLILTKQLFHSCRNRKASFHNTLFKFCHLLFFSFLAKKMFNEIVMNHIVKPTFRLLLSSFFPKITFFHFFFKSLN